MKKQSNIAKKKPSSVLPERGLVIAHHGKQVWIQPHLQTTNAIRCHLRFKLLTIVAGDIVEFEKIDNNKGLVTKRLARQNELAKSDHRHNKKVIAANINTIWIVIAPTPNFTLLGIDRYLIAAQLANINAGILVNKIDLLSEKQYLHLTHELKIYEKIGYPILYTSTHSEKYLEALKATLSHQTSFFIGQSGVGKSSLISTLLPNQSIRIGPLSNIQQGCHTTTTTRLMPLDEGGYLVDSPGLRELSLTYLTKEHIFQGFKEFNAFWQRCQFSNCAHHHDLGCALIAAVKNGDIAPSRMASFQILNRELNKSYKTS
ncbi:MAG: ribosome small subunit-dependent GTPase A [Endozoicomonadaceae bacterium]|nr:ribosome small subunit-dependent GTPase A [Endozoicomonadaceae bacterium]